MNSASRVILASILCLQPTLSLQAAGDAPAPQKAAKAQTGVFYVYADKGAQGNHFAPSGWMGDYGDLKIDDASKDEPADGKTCFKVSYSGKATQGANWAGIYWQHPPNNWGTNPGGFDLSKMKRMSFWARGAQGGEVISEFKVGGITGEFADSDSASIGPVTLTKDWKKYTIDLNGKNLSHVVGGFAWAASRDNNPNGFIIYFDEVRFES
jgi:hypothetical protein